MLVIILNSKLSLIFYMNFKVGVKFAFGNNLFGAEFTSKRKYMKMNSIAMRSKRLFGRITFRTQITSQT